MLNNLSAIRFSLIIAFNYLEFNIISNNLSEITFSTYFLIALTLGRKFNLDSTLSRISTSSNGVN